MSREGKKGKDLSLTGPQHSMPHGRQGVGVHDAVAHMGPPFVLTGHCSVFKLNWSQWLHSVIKSSNVYFCSDSDPHTWVSLKNLEMEMTTHSNILAWEFPWTEVSGELVWSAAAAAAKSLQSCPTLCNPIDGSPPGTPVPGILQARTLEWVAISFSNALKWKVKGKSLGHVRRSATPWTAAQKAPPSMGFSRQVYWSGVPLPSPLVQSMRLQKSWTQLSN